MMRGFIQDGFTLIELMITVAVIGILAAIAYPSFSEYVAKSRRATAVGILLESQQWMERFYTENFRYDQNSAHTAVTDASQFPAWFSVSPKPGDGSTMYKIEVLSSSRDMYTVTASRTGSMANDRCGDFQVDQYGRKKLIGFDSAKFSTHAKALEYCWK